MFLLLPKKGTALKSIANNLRVKGMVLLLPILIERKEVVVLDDVKGIFYSSLVSSC